MIITRRGFLQSLGLVVGGVAIAEAIPLGRVWSFPSQIVVARAGYLNLDDFIGRYLEPAMAKLLNQMATQHSVTISQNSLLHTSPTFWPPYNPALPTQTTRIADPVGLVVPA